MLLMRVTDAHKPQTTMRFGCLLFCRELDAFVSTVDVKKGTFCGIRNRLVDQIPVDPSLELDVRYVAGKVQKG